MAQTRTVSGRTQWFWNGHWHTVPPATGGTTPAPAPAQAPTPQAPAFDPNAANRLGLLQRNFADQNASFDAQELQTKQRYGLDDSSDPHSQLADLKQAFETRRRSATTGMAAAGQLYSGALNNAQGYNQQFFDKGYDTLRKAQSDALARIATARTQARSDFEGGNLDVQDAATGAAIQNRPDASDYAPGLTLPTPPKPKQPSPSGAAQRRSQRRSLGITDIRRASSRQIRRARSRGYL